MFQIIGMEALVLSTIFLDTVLVDTIYTMPNGWSNLNQIDIKLNTFNAALNQIDLMVFMF